MASTSLLLDLNTWDLCVDARRNIAVCSEPYAFVQDASCQAMLFQGELNYDTTQGVPYWDDILGHWPAPSVLKAYVTSEATRATGVDGASMFITSWAGRIVRGILEISVAGTPVRSPIRVVR